MKSCTRSPPRRSGPTTTRSVVPSRAQQQDLERITEIIVVQLVIADAVEPHRCGWRHHEVERGPHRPPVGKRRRQTAGRDRLRAQIGNPHEPAGGVRLELQQGANLVGSELIGHARILRSFTRKLVSRTVMDAVAFGPPARRPLLLPTPAPVATPADRIGPPRAISCSRPITSQSTQTSAAVPSASLTGSISTTQKRQQKISPSEFHLIRDAQ